MRILYIECKHICKYLQTIPTLRQLEILFTSGPNPSQPLSSIPLTFTFSNS